MTDAHPTDDAQTARTLLGQIQAHVVELLGEEDPEFVTDLLDTFIASARGAEADARAARFSRDADAVAAAAHKLRGSASNVGLTTIADLWTRVEEGIRQGESAALGDGVDRALAETTRAVDLLARAASA